MRMYLALAPPLMLCLLTLNSGCAGLRDYAISVGQGIVDGRVGGIKKSLQEKYGIDPTEDSLADSVRKMVAVEGKDNPSLMTKLIQNPPESWGDLAAMSGEIFSVLTDKDKRTAELEADKGTLKATAGGIGGLLVLKLLYFFGVARRRHKKTEKERDQESKKLNHLYVKIEDKGDAALKKSISKGSPEVIAGIAEDVAELARA